MSPVQPVMSLGIVRAPRGRAVRAHLMVWVPLLMWANTVVQAQLDTAAYARIVRISGEGDVSGLLAMADELDRHASAQDHHMAMLARAMADFRSDRMAPCAERLDSLRHAEPRPDDRLLAVMHKFQAGVLQRSGERHAGMAEIDAGLALADSVRLPMERVDLLVMKAEFLFDAEANEEALTLLAKAQRLAERTGYMRGLCMVRINLGNFRYAQERWEEAMADYRSALDMATFGGFDLLAENCANNIGAVAASAGKFDLALRLFDSLRTALGGQRPAFRAALSGQIGYIRDMQGDHAAALPILQQAIALSDSLGDARAAADTRQYLASALWALGRRQEAIAERRKVLDAMMADGDGHMEVETRWILWEWYEAIGDKDAALREARIMSLLDDSLEHVRYNDRVALSEVRFETERKEHRIAEQQQALLLAESEQKRRSTQRDLAIAVAAAIGILALFLIDRRRRRASHEKEQAVLRERLRIADDLHDDLGAGLSSLKLRSALAVERAVAPGQEEALNALAGTADGLMENMRQILWAMGTEHTTLVDLVRYITVYARQLLDERGIALDTRSESELPGVELNAMERRNIFLVVKEALHNVVKHAQAKQVTLTFRWANGLEVSVADDGTGIAETSAPKGNGMRTMRKRAQALGGEVRVSAGQGSGTTVSLSVPLQRPLNKRPIAPSSAPTDLRTDG